jgi:hypothetical protein
MSTRRSRGWCRPALVVALALSALPCMRRPGAARGGMVPYPVKMRGFVGAPPEGAPVLKHWVVRIKQDRFDFAVTQFTILTGRASYSDIAAAVAPYPVAFELAGNDLDVFRSTPSGQEIEIYGNLTMGGGARIFIVSSVRPVGGTPPGGK